MNDREQAREYAYTLLRRDYPEAWVERWLNRRNKNLGNRTPADLITLGEWQKVIDLIHRERTARTTGRLT